MCPRILKYMSQKNVICHRNKENPRIAPEKYGMYAKDICDL